MPLCGLAFGHPADCREALTRLGARVLLAAAAAIRAAPLCPPPTWRGNYVTPSEQEVVLCAHALLPEVHAASMAAHRAPPAAPDFSPPCRRTPCVGDAVTADTSGEVFDVVEASTMWATIAARAPAEPLPPNSRLQLRDLVVAASSSTTESALDDLPFAERWPAEATHFAAAAQQPPTSRPAPPAACTCGRSGYGSGRHYATCPRSSQAARRHAPRHVRDGEGDQHTTSAAPPPPTNPAAPTVAIPSWSEVARTNLGILGVIPRGAVMAVQAAFLWTLERVTTDPTSWLRLFAFAKCVLAHPGVGKAVVATVRERCRRWRAGDFGALWLEAADIGQLQRPRESPGLPVDDESAPPHLRNIWGVLPEDEGIVPLNAKRCERLARLGHYAKAVAALSPAALLPPTEEVLAELQALHPRRQARVTCDLTGGAAGCDVAAPTMSQLKRGLRSFPLGSSGGAGRLTPAHIRQLCAVNGAMLLPTLGDVVHRIMCGRVPAEARPFTFGAALSALSKKKPGDAGDSPVTGGGVRPIASGETLRRLAAKLLCGTVKPAARDFFLARHQVGVAVQGGLEAQVHASRMWLVTHKPGDVFLKVDIKNAFNTVSRQVALQCVATHFPVLLPYATAAYAAPTELTFGEFALQSEEGTQQGDPLAPLIFSLALSVPVEATLAELQATPLDFVGFYLDDGCFAGPAETVATALSIFSTKCREIGLDVNLGKCEVFCEASLATRFPGVKHAPTLTLLGAPLGTAAEANAFVDKELGRARAKLRSLEQLSPHIAFTLLRYCVSFGIGVFYARTCGRLPCMDAFDKLVRSTACSILGFGEEDTRLWRRMSLPTRLGGFGIRPLAEHAAGAAIVAASCSTRLYGTFFSTAASPAPSSRPSTSHDAPAVDATPW